MFGVRMTEHCMRYLQLLQDDGEAPSYDYDKATTNSDYILCFNLVCEMINYMEAKLKSEEGKRSEGEEGVAILLDRLNDVRNEINTMYQGNKRSYLLDAFATMSRSCTRCRQLVINHIGRDIKVKRKYFQKIHERRRNELIRNFLWQCLFVLKDGHEEQQTRIAWNDVKDKIAQPIEIGRGPLQHRLYDDNLDVSDEQAPYEECALCYVGLCTVCFDDYVWFEPMKVCSICRLAFYCSKECQVKHWRAGHRKVCDKSLGVSGSSARAEGKAKAKAKSRPDMVIPTYHVQN